MRSASHKRADVQGLRALAVLLVVGYHAGLPLPSGFAGVDVFFVISGFVITATLVRELAGTGRLRLGAFYARRVRRLLPALTVVLVFVAAVGVLGSPIAAQKTAGLTGIAASLFSANFYLYHLGSGYFDVSAGLNPLLHTWTLGVEEQFYLVFPALLLASWKLGRRALAVVAVGGATALSFYLAYRYALAFPVGGVHDPQRFGFYASPSRAWEFGAGSLVALGVPLFRRIPFGLTDVVAAAGLAWLVVGLLVLDGRGVPSAGETALLVTGVALLLVAGSGHGSLVARGLGARPAVWIGDLSYSWYLWHWPLIVFARALWPGSVARRSRGRSRLAAPRLALVPLRREPDPRRPARARQAGASPSPPPASPSPAPPRQDWRSHRTDSRRARRCGAGSGWSASTPTICAAAATPRRSARTRAARGAFAGAVARSS